MQVHDALQQRPTTSLNEATARLSITHPIAAKGMKALVDLGIARELTRRKRNRIYVYSEYPAVLSDVTEPMATKDG